jgi:hypothetical protein
MAGRPHVHTDGKAWKFVGYGVEIDLPSPANLKRRALEEAYGEHAGMREQVIELLEACTFDYEVVQGKDAITWLLGIIVFTDAPHAGMLEDIGDPVVHCSFGSIELACSVGFGWSRVVVCE